MIDLECGMSASTLSDQLGIEPIFEATHLVY